MDTAVVPTAPKPGPITLEELRRAQSDVFLAGLAVKELDGGAAVRGEYGSRKDQTVVYFHAVLCHDKRVKLTFTKPDNAFDDAVLLMKEFDKERAFASALRIAVGDSNPRFRGKERVLAFVKRVGVTEVAKTLPPVFSDFMFAVLHAFNCKLGKDIGEQVKALRHQIQGLVPHLSEADILRIYREEVVDWVSKS
jgi:hypothetical protein